MLRRHLQVALVTTIALGTTLPLYAADKKVPEQKKLEGFVSELYATDNWDTTKREEIFLKIDKVLSKKKGYMEAALSVPKFWAGAIHAGRFSKRSGESAKRVKEKEIAFALDNGKKAKVKIAFHGASTYKKKSAYPLLLTILEEGQDAKAYVDNLVKTQEALKKGWILAAVAADKKQFPVVADPDLAIKAIISVREWFNVDSNKWFVAGHGATCSAVQELATSVIPDRVAGIVLHNPTEAKSSSNSSMTTAFVVHDDAGKAVAEAWSKLDETNNKAAAAGAEGEAAALAWLLAHTGRKSPTSYSFETTLTEDKNTGPDWTGTLRIISPDKRGEKTTIGVDYDRKSNTVSIAAENLGEFIIYMNDELLDLSKEVTIKINDVEVEKKIFERRMREMFDQADTVGEFGRVFPASYRGVVKTEAPAAEEGDGKEGEKKDGGDK